jgi:hypothetical protein
MNTIPINSNSIFVEDADHSFRKITYLNGEQEVIDRMLIWMDDCNLTIAEKDNDENCWLPFAKAIDKNLYDSFSLILKRQGLMVVKS